MPVGLRKRLSLHFGSRFSCSGEGPACLRQSYTCGVVGTSRTGFQSSTCSSRMLIPLSTCSGPSEAGATLAPRSPDTEYPDSRTRCRSRLSLNFRDKHARGHLGHLGQLLHGSGAPGEWQCSSCDPCGEQGSTGRLPTARRSGNVKQMRFGDEKESTDDPL